MTREWPADGPPRDWLYPLAAVVTLTILSIPIMLAGLGWPGCLAAGLVAGLCLAAFLGPAPTPAAELSRARRAVLLGEDPWNVIGRVRGLELEGGPRRCRDVAVRCRRMDGRLRGAAAMWLREARDEVEKGRDA